MTSIVGIPSEAASYSEDSQRLAKHRCNGKPIVFGGPETYNSTLPIDEFNGSTTGRKDQG